MDATPLLQEALMTRSYRRRARRHSSRTRLAPLLVVAATLGCVYAVDRAPRAAVALAAAGLLVVVIRRVWLWRRRRECAQAVRAAARVVAKRVPLDFALEPCFGCDSTRVRVEGFTARRAAIRVRCAGRGCKRRTQVVRPVSPDSWRSADAFTAFLRAKDRLSRLTGADVFVPIYVETPPAAYLYEQNQRPHIPAEKRAVIFARYGYRCARCGSEHDLHLDHDVPVSRGGSSGFENLQPLCRSCNLRKAAS